MPTIEVEDTTLDCDHGELLRDVLLAAGKSPHNGRSQWLNCRGLGTCGTCAVDLEGDIPEPTPREQRRLAFPPHSPECGLRLACQVPVTSDLRVRKYDGFWGQHVE